MKAEELAISEKDCWRNIAITLRTPNWAASGAVVDVIAC